MIARIRISYSVLLVLLVFLTSCFSSTPKDDKLDTGVITNPNTAGQAGDKTTLPVIHFEEMEHDFGKIIEGETVSFAFTFTNKGKSDLVIADVSTSCGCTVPSYPKTAIGPGEQGHIRIAFNSRGRRGYQTKSIVVVANTQPNVTQLKIKAQVIAPGAD